VKANPLVSVLATLGLVLLDPGSGASTGTALRSDQEKVPVPVPVLLVPGWLGRARDLEALRGRFLRDGWDDREVVALEFADPVGSNRDHAREIEAALRRLQAETGAPEVDMVVHSMGGLALWLLLREKGDTLPLRRVVFLGSPLQGTLTAYLAWGEGGPEMRPGSALLVELLAGEKPQRWVEAMTIRTPLDLNVVPGSGAALPGLGDRLVCCPTHQGLLDHEETYRTARDFLLRGVAREGGSGSA
jgi:pimeloyl-ACP methyl ester carboxylesterase